MLSLVVTYLLITSKALDPEIDQEHLNEYPYCGLMTTEHMDTSDMDTDMGTSGRAVNAKNGSRDYRWVVLIRHLAYHKACTARGLRRSSYCAGTVVTDR